MSKAFTRESDSDSADRDDDGGDALPAQAENHAKNYVTPTGHAALQAELAHLRQEERPKVVEVVTWAASNGDRSENADYHYGKKRLREIDRRVRYLTRRLESAVRAQEFDARDDRVEAQRLALVDHLWLVRGDVHVAAQRSDGLDEVAALHRLFDETLI